MLYPKEDRLNNTLMFACRTCQFSEPATSSCVFRNNLYNTVGETAGVTQDVGADPTVGLSNFSTSTFCGEKLLCVVYEEQNCKGFLSQIDDGCNGVIYGNVCKTNMPISPRKQEVQRLTLIVDLNF